MSIIIKLQGLPLEAASVDVRRYFLGLTIPDGGVHIVGGDDGTVFIEFSSDEDARQAMARDDGNIKNSKIRLLLSSRTEMQSVIEAARQRQQQYLQQQQQLQSQLQQNNLLQQQNLNQTQQSYLSGISPMGPALLPTSLQQPQQQQTVPFEGDPRMLSQNYQGMMNVVNQQPQSPKNHQQSSHQQQPPQQTQPSPFIDPRILSQNYQGMMSALTQNHPQPLLPQQNQIFNQFPPTTIATSNSDLGLSLLGNVCLTSNEVGLNPAVVGVARVEPLGAPGNVGSNGNNANLSNRNHSPDNRARMSGMRGGDDKLFANKRCVLAASNIPYRATSKDIIEFLSEFNIKEDCIRRRYNQKGQPTADAKIAFPNPDAAMKAFKTMNKKTLCGRPVFLKPV